MITSRFVLVGVVPSQLYSAQDITLTLYLGLTPKTRAPIDGYHLIWNVFFQPSGKGRADSDVTFMRYTLNVYHNRFILNAVEGIATVESTPNQELPAKIHTASAILLSTGVTFQHNIVTYFVRRYLSISQHAPRIVGLSRQPYRFPRGSESMFQHHRQMLGCMHASRGAGN